MDPVEGKKAVGNQSAWMTAALSFIGQQAVDPSHPERAKEVLPKQSAKQLLCAMDKLLVSTIGSGLDFFQAPVGPDRRPPVLTMCMDEGSTNWCSVWYLCYKANLFLVPMRDIFHREWNDVKLAVKDQGHTIVGLRRACLFLHVLDILSVNVLCPFSIFFRAVC